MISLILTAADRDFLRPWGGAATVCKTDQEQGYLLPLWVGMGGIFWEHSAWKGRKGEIRMETQGVEPLCPQIPGSLGKVGSGWATGWAQGSVQKG